MCHFKRLSVVFLYNQKNHNWLYKNLNVRITLDNKVRKSLFYQKQSFKLVNDHKEMKLSLELHGLRRHINR